AKRAIVEAVAPRIRELIEKELLGEAADEGMGCESDEDEEKPDKILTDKKPADSSEESNESTVSMETVTNEVDETLNVEEAVEKVVSTSSPDGIDEVEQKLLYIERMLGKLTSTSTRLSESNAFNLSLINLNEMVEAIYGYIQENVEDPNVRLGYGLKLRKCLTKLEKLQETKMNRDLLNEEDVALTITGLPDDLDLEGLGVTLQKGEEGEEAPEGEEAEAPEGEEEAPEGGEGEEALAGEEDMLGGEDEVGKKEESLNLSDDMLVEIDENMLRREIAKMKALREAHDESHDVQAWGHGAGEVSDEFVEDDMGEPLELDLSEALAELDGAASQGTPAELEDYAAEASEVDEMEEVDEMYEVDEMDDAHEAKVGHAQLEVDVDEELEEVMSQAKDSEEHNTKGKNVQSRQPESVQTESIRKEMAKELKLQEVLRKRASELKKLYEATKKVATKSSTLVETKKAAAHGAKIKTAYAETAELYNGSVTRFNKLSRALSESARKNVRSNSNVTPAASAGTDTLSKKLAETNLLNA
ncbi:MAG: hypothetical protein EBU90_29230, partial [Proteobacteria bacterium]|nr:hypothetical protein [Pseudomonadota bacterium]